MQNQLKLWSVIAGAVACSLTSFGGASSPPTVSNVTMEQDNNRLVTITYEIAEAPGIVTLDILTNGVSIGAGNIKFVNGDVNREVEPGPHTITWRPDKSWPGHKVDDATAKVCVWDKSAPPDYMTVELTTPYEKKWYTCEAALPEGIESDYYRGDVLLMRRICRPKGGVWVMGSPTDGEPGRNEASETPHRVTLTNDFWIGVFEVTQKQWVLVNGGVSPAYFKGDPWKARATWATRPVECVSYDTIRGKDAEFHYPNNPKSDSFLGKLRILTEIQSFDLPSEMQWEYACRAGTGSAVNNGKPLTNGSGRDPAMDLVGRHCCNGGMIQDEEGNWSPDQGTARVGSYQPNAWGLYDMHGNVCEWCLDWLTDNITDLDGRVNTVSGTDRVLRGGSWYNYPANCRSAYRFGLAPSTVPYDFGFASFAPQDCNPLKRGRSLGRGAVRSWDTGCADRKA